MATKYPGNELDPAEWVRGWRRALGVCLILGSLAAVGLWIDGWAADERSHGALIAGAFLGVLSGFALLSWTLLRIGRLIALPLLRLLAIAERTEQHRQSLQDSEYR